MTGIINHWIETAGEHVVAALDLALSDPDKFVKCCEKDEKATAKLVGDSLAINYYALWLVTKYLGGSEATYTFCQFCLENLSRHSVIHKIRKGNEDIYGLSFQLMKPYREAGQLGGLALGPPYFVEKYRKSIVEVCVVDDDGDFSTGTGFLVRDEEGRCNVFTCKHVLFNRAEKIRKIEHIKIDGVFVTPKTVAAFNRIDVCVIILKDDISGRGLHFSLGELLEEITTAGFPKIMLTTPSTLLYHRGHINGWTGSQRELGTAGIISAGTAPGCSGGPVFNSYGGVVGIVDQRIETSFKDGESKYNGMIPAELILTELEARQVADPVPIG